MPDSSTRLHRRRSSCPVPDTTFLALAAGLATNLAAAQSAPPAAGEGSNFTQHKQQELTRINTHLQIMQTLQSCVQSAANPADMKRCNEAARAARPHAG